MTARHRQSCAVQVSSEFDQSPIDFQGKSPLLTRTPVAKESEAFVKINVLGTKQATANQPPEQPHVAEWSRNGQLEEAVIFYAG